MNEPRCEMGPGADRCLNQAAGTWVVNAARTVLVCEDHRRELADQRIYVEDDGWEPVHPDPVQSAIDRRVLAMAGGYFG